MKKTHLVLTKKDIYAIVSNKKTLMVLLMVPLAMTVVLPSIFVLVTLLAPGAAEDFDKLLAMLPVAVQGMSQNQMVVSLILNKIMPVFFLMIPIMASSVMAASSFVGEKEKHTLETLLYSPLSIRDVFQAKILAGFCVGMVVSLLSFAAMVLVVEIEVLAVTGSGIWPDISWLIVMLLIAPAISLVAIAITVRGSAKAETIEEAQQRAVFLIFPLIALVVGQFMGVILIKTRLLIVIGIVLAICAAFLMKGVAGKFTYEELLK